MVYKAIIVSLILIWIYWALRMFNPFKFFLYIGKNGSGKSTIAARDIKKGKRVLFYDKTRKPFHRFRLVKLKIYTNFSLNVPGLEYERFNPTDLGITFMPDELSILYIDEISLYWWNRQYKSMDPRTVEWFRNQRKYMVAVRGFTQTFDVDKVLRKSLCDRMYLVKNFLITFAVVRRIAKDQKIKESALDCDSQLVESLKFEPIFIPGAIQFIWIPSWIKYFDTKEVFRKQQTVVKSPLPPLLNR